MRFEPPDFMFTFTPRLTWPTFRDGWPWLLLAAFTLVMGEMSWWDAGALLLAFAWGHLVWTIFLLCAFPLNKKEWAGLDDESHWMLVRGLGYSLVGARLFSLVPLLFFHLNCFTDWVVLGVPW